jgi:hypothetical protein
VRCGGRPQIPQIFMQKKVPMTPNQFVAATLIAGVCASVPLQVCAADLPGSGKFEFTSCLAGKETSIGHAPNYAVGTADTLGTQRSEPPGSLFDLTSSRCVYRYSYIDGKYDADGFCEFLDAQGDKYLLKINREPGQGGTLQGMHGTGKYAGMKLRGAYERIAPFPATPGNTHACVKATGEFSFQ